MDTFELEPEVAGGWGGRTRADTSVHPPIVYELDYCFEGWLGDDIIETFPCFAISSRLKEELVKSDLTGFELAPLIVSCSPEFSSEYVDVPPSGFVWLKIQGETKSCDFSLGRNFKLRVTERALAVLQRFRLGACRICRVEI